MVRNFSDEAVDPEAIERILDLARRAPSAGYTQGQSFIVVTNPETRLAVAKCCHEESYVSGGFDPFVSRAPVQIIVCANEADYHRRYQQPDKTNEDGSEIEWPVPYWHVDAGCAAMIVLLAAVNEGLAAGFAGVIDHDTLRSLLGMPQEVTAIGVLPIGHRAPDKPSPSLKRGRRDAVQVIHRERW
jgi:nitroreductase